MVINIVILLFLKIYNTSNNKPKEKTEQADKEFYLNDEDYCKVFKK